MTANKLKNIIPSIFILFLITPSPSFVGTEAGENIFLCSDHSDCESNVYKAPLKKDKNTIKEATFPNNGIERAASSPQLNITRHFTYLFQFKEQCTQKNIKKQIVLCRLSHSLFFSNISEQGYYTIALQKLRF